MELEPNNDPTTANGPLCAQTGYQGLPSDMYDYYYVELSNSGMLTLDLANYVVPDLHGQLILYDSGMSMVSRVYTAPFHLSQWLAPGKYYILVFTENAYLNSNVYTLTADFEQCRAGTTEIEPNNALNEADGPLCSGVTYAGLPYDNNDYFYINLTSSATIVVDLTNYTVADTHGWLIISDEAYNNIAYTYAAPFHLQQSLSAGKYYIRVFTETGYTSSTPYSLKITSKFYTFIPVIQK